LLLLIDDLTLRLRTITASGPAIAGEGERIISEMLNYRQVVSSYYENLEELGSHLEALKGARNVLLKEMSIHDQRISDTTQRINSNLLRIVVLSKILVLVITIAIVLTVGFIILQLFRSMEKEIKERKLAEQALDRSEENIQSVFRIAPTGIGVVVDRVITQVNKRISEITGYSKWELIGRDARMLYPSDEDYEYVGREKYRQIQDHGTGTVETLWKRKDGTIVDILLSSTPLVIGKLEEGVV
jgi:PAS domain S-box-containing protein